VGERTETEAKKYKGKKSKVNADAGGGENERSGWTEQKEKRDIRQKCVDAGVTEEQRNGRSCVSDECDLGPGKKE
jgi:hypothetical protein